MKALGGDGYIDGVALFFELFDWQIKLLSEDKKWLYDQDFIQLCFRSKGNHAHIYALYNGGDSKRILKQLRFLLKTYKTVSFYDPQFNFHIYRRK